jgi:ADP-heptose:LPS heptosyltransferase
MSERVLVARMDSAGDVLLAGPAVRAVARSAAHVTLLCGPRGRAAAELLPGVDEILCHHCPWIDAEPEPVSRAATEALVADVAAIAPTVAFVLTSFHQSPLPLALLLRLAGVPRIAATSVDYPGSLLDVRHRIDDDVHEVQRSLHLVATLGYTLAPGDDGALQLRGATSAAHWSPPAERYVVVHPGASVPARAWAPQRHAELVRALAGDGRHVVVTGEPAEVALTARVAGPPQRHVTDLGGRTSLGQLAQVLAGAEAVVVGNTGPAHLAAAVGTPIVSTFAPTVPAVRWRPWGVPHELLFEDVPCAGCRARSCPVPGHPCLAGVSVEDVLAAIDRVTASERAAVAA